MKQILTVCPYCAVGCNFYLEVDNGRVVGLTPSLNHPVNQGGLCIKGWHAYQVIHHPERLKHPLKKEGDRFVQISWDEAIDLVAGKFASIKEKYGPDAFAVIGSARYTNEENFLIQKFARAVLGTNNVDHCARICHSPTVTGLSMAFGSGAMTNSIAEIEDARMLLVVGSNTTEAHPLIARRIVRALRKGAKLVVVDPRRTEISELAHIHIPLQPNSDIILFTAMAKIIYDRKLHNSRFIEKHTEGFDEYLKFMEKFDLNEVEAITEIPLSTIEEVAIMYATTDPASIIYCLGVTEHLTGTENVLSLANLALLTGHIGKPSSGVNPLRGQNNVQGASDMAVLAEFLPGYQRYTDPETVAKFEREWKVKIPTTPGLTIGEYPDAVLDGKIKAMYITGEDPALTDPDASRVQKALASLEFLVVQDIFMTKTAEFADIVLPAALWAEKDGTFTNTERRIQRIRKAVDPPGEAKPDWEIISMIARKMGFDWNYTHPSEIMDEIARLVPIYAGVSYDRLENGWGLQWPVRSKDHPGTPYLHKDGNFARGKGKFHIVHYRPPSDERNEEYPFYLVTGRHGFHWHVGSMTGKSPELEREYPRPFIVMNRSEAEKAGIREGAQVLVRSRRGQIRAFVKYGILSKNTVFMPMHFPEEPVNFLMPNTLDPYSKMPDLKVAAVRIEPLSNGGGR